MIRSLSHWTWLGIWLLALTAGTINVIGIMSFEHQPVSHLTGTTSLLAQALAEQNLSALVRFAGLMLAFVAGCAVSEIVLKGTALRAGVRYGSVLAMESACLIGAVLLIARENLAALPLAAAACGLQNAMVSTYSGSIIRTTHVSGMFTDLGIFLGHRLRGLPVDRHRLRLCLTVISGFLCGGAVAALAFHRWSTNALWIPAGITAIAAAGFLLRRTSLPPAITH